MICQTYQNLQIILIDDGSSDTSGEICDSFAADDSRIEVVHQENKGVSYARNIGLCKRKGDYFVILDSDDTIEPDTISDCMNGFSTANTNAVFYGVKKIFSDGTEERVINNPGSYDNLSIIHGILSDYTSYGAGFPVNKLWHVSVDTEVPLFDSELYYFEDMEWVIRMLLTIQNVEILDKYLYNYFIRDDSTTRKTGNEERREIGYHDSVLQIINDLDEHKELQEWFTNNYYPQLVNGIINAWQKKWVVLRKKLANLLPLYSKNILNNRQLSIKIRFRCIILLTLIRFKLL